MRSKAREQYVVSEVSKLKTKLQSVGLDLWDFGEAQTVMPEPPSDKSYLVTSIVVIFCPDLVDQKVLMMPIELPWLTPAVQLSDDFVPHIVEAFRTHNRRIDKIEIGKIGTPLKLPQLYPEDLL